MVKVLILMHKYWIILTLVLLLLITGLLLCPLSSLPAVPGGDKIHHFLAYAALMFPVGLQKPKYWLIIGFAFICWSVGIELVQPQFNRTEDWMDLFPSGLGLICGLLLAQLLNWIIPIRRRENSE